MNDEISAYNILDKNDKTFIKEFSAWLQSEFGIIVESVENSPIIRLFCNVKEPVAPNPKSKRILSGEFVLTIYNDFQIFSSNKTKTGSEEEEISLFLRTYLLMKYRRTYAQEYEKFIQKDFEYKAKLAEKIRFRKPNNPHITQQILDGMYKKVNKKPIHVANSLRKSLAKIIIMAKMNSPLFVRGLFKFPY